MHPLLGQSPVFQRALASIQRVAAVEVPVLIQGETGTGKELAAHAIHYGSPRRHGPFVPLNCGALPETLIESELYGHERGAFTDAHAARGGVVAAAEGGTLFLDEIDALPMRAQVSLLRFLQDQSYRSVGGTRQRQGNVRVIAAASPRLGALLRDGAFREDLAFRLDVLHVHMPALRERGDDVLLLARHFIERHRQRLKQPPRGLDEACLPWMRHHRWPGNVRELDNRVQRALVMSSGDHLWIGPDDDDETPGALPAPPQVLSSRGPGLPGFNVARDLALQRFETDYLQRLMHLTDGNVTRAAALAGKERRSLGRLLKKHGLAGRSLH
jgi:DNA-binding NtrC family response regulator